MFKLHPRLAADTIEITRWHVSLVLLMKDANYPWLILVPARDALSGLHELSGADRSILMDEIARASNAMQEIYVPARINVAALGNVVEQLHVHIIARFEDDPAWPAPIWGVKTALDYSAKHLENTIQRLRKVLEGINMRS